MFSAICLNNFEVGRVAGEVLTQLGQDGRKVLPLWQIGAVQRQKHVSRAGRRQCCKLTRCDIINTELRLRCHVH